LLWHADAAVQKRRKKRNKLSSYFITFDWYDTGSLDSTVEWQSLYISQDFLFFDDGDIEIY
jgi:hypothetical protein